jgi:hypothetical protein
MVLSKGLAGWCLQDWEVAASLRRVYAARNGARVAIQRPRLVSHGLLRSWNTSNGEAHGSPRRCRGGHSSTYRITATPEVQPVVVILKRKIDLGALKVVTPPWHAVCRTRLCAAAVPKLSETTGYSQLFAAAAFPSRFDFCRGDAGWLNSAEMSAPRYVIKITGPGTIPGHLEPLFFSQLKCHHHRPKAKVHASRRGAARGARLFLLPHATPCCPGQKTFHWPTPLRPVTFVNNEDNSSTLRGGGRHSPVWSRSC